MYLSKPITLLAIIPFSVAIDCTVSRSSPWPFSGGSASSPSRPSPGGSVTDLCAQFKNDASAYQACTKAALDGQCLAVGGSGCGGRSSISSDGSKIANDLIGRELRGRATLTCSAAEVCYQYTDKSLRCYNLGTGDYHDDNGGTGNYIRGTYTGADGKATAKATSTTPGSRASTATPSSAERGSFTTSTVSSDSGASTGTTTNASATPSRSSGAEAFRPGAVTGILGMIAALFL